MATSESEEHIGKVQASPPLKMTEVLVEIFRKHPERVSESRFVGVAPNLFPPLNR